MAKFRKKPVVIEAIRWRGYSSRLGITDEAPDQPSQITEDNMDGIKWGPLPAWLPAITHVVSDGQPPTHPNPMPGEIWRNNEDLWIGTLEGTMICSPGDWIIRGIKGELYPCKPDIFTATYEAAA
jgi:hypothetical protein